MTFRSGLLAARGQITFIAALAISTAVIIQLESLDTESRVQARVIAELERRQDAGAFTEEMARAVAASLRSAEDAYGAAPDTEASRVALLTALTAAVQTRVLERAEAQPRVEAILTAIETEETGFTPALAAALSVTAVVFPGLQERISRLRVFA